MSRTSGLALIWLWSNYNEGVNMTAPWATLQDLNFNNYPGKVILAGRRGSYAWNYMDPNTTNHAFICRKQGLSSCLMNSHVCKYVLTHFSSCIHLTSSMFTVQRHSEPVLQY